MNFKNSFSSLIGGTPLLRLDCCKIVLGLKCDIFAKLEMYSPTGSVKDRIAAHLIETAVLSGKINKNTVIIEPTSGNTGIGLAAVCAAKGLKLTVVMPDSMSRERREMIKIYGANLVLTEGSLGMRGAIDKAAELAADNPDSFIPTQFENLHNPEIHEKTTAPELFEALEGNIDIFVSAVGTGGTLTGCARYLKPRIPDIGIVAVEPESSPVLSKNQKGSHKIQGIGAGFVPKTLDVSLIDRIITISDKEAYETMRFLAKTEGIFAGISSGAALAAAFILARENSDKNITVIFPDGGTRYLSNLD